MRMTCYNGLYADITDKIIRKAIDVHRELGCGLKEEAYESEGNRVESESIGTEYAFIDSVVT